MMGKSSGEIPIPVSVRAILMQPSLVKASMVMDPPLLVNRMALDSRLRNTCLIRSSSAYKAGILSSMRLWIFSLLLIIRSLNVLTQLVMSFSR